MWHGLGFRPAVREGLCAICTFQFLWEFAQMKLAADLSYHLQHGRGVTYAGKILLDLLISTTNVQI
jgi:hypothetical protein